DDSGDHSTNLVGMAMPFPTSAPLSRWISRFIASMGRTVFTSKQTIGSTPTHRSSTLLTGWYRASEPMLPTVTNPATKVVAPTARMPPVTMLTDALARVVRNATHAVATPATASPCTSENPGAKVNHSRSADAGPVTRNGEMASHAPAAWAA